jgi:hypothetical protein
LQSFLLSSYTSSGWNDICGGKGYSDEKNDIPLIRSMAMSIISESTPDVMLKALSVSGSMNNGHIPRQTILRVTGKKPYRNRVVKKELDSDIKSRLEKLIGKCSEIQAKDVLEYDDVWHFVFKDSIETSMFEWSNYCTDVENDPDNKGTPKGIMASRAAVKAMKYAAIAMVFNYEHELVMQKEEWEWGLELAKYELDSVDDFFSGLSFNNALDDISRRIVGPSMYRLLTKNDKGEYGGADLQSQLNHYEIGKQYIPFTKICRELRNKRGIQYDDRMTQNECLKRVLRYMCDDMGYINRVKDALDQTNKLYKCEVYRPSEYFLNLFK